MNERMTDEEIFDAYGQDVIVWFHTTHEEVRVTQVRQGDEGPQEDQAELFLKAVISTYHILNTFFKDRVVEWLGSLLHTHLDPGSNNPLGQLAFVHKPCPG